MTFSEHNDPDGNPVVQHEYFENFRLKSGATIPTVRLGFCVFGANPKENPLIVLHPALTGSPKAYVTGKGSQGDGWFIHCLGPGKFLDTNSYTVICIDHLGGNGDSSSAVELKQFRNDLSYADEISLIVELLKRHSVTKVHAVVGGSIGGGQALEWLTQEEIAIDRIFDISGSAAENGKTSEFFGMQRDLLWGEGKNIAQLIERLNANHAEMLGKSKAFDFVFGGVINELRALESGYTQTAALQIARKIGFLRFVTPLFFDLKWQYYFDRSNDEAFAFARVQSWMDHQGEIFPERFSADALAQLCHMDASAPAREPRFVAELLAKRNTKLIGFTVQGDVLFDCNRQQDFYRRVREAMPREKQDLITIHVVKDEINGHDHFLTEEFLESAKALAKSL